MSERTNDMRGSQLPYAEVLDAVDEGSLTSRILTFGGGIA